MNAKSLYLLIITCWSTIILGQDSLQLNLKLIQGIQQDEFTFLDGEGYSILTYQQKKKYSTKTIKKLKKKFNIDKSTKGVRSSEIEIENITFEEESDENGITSFRKNVIFKVDEKRTKLIELTTSLDRDTIFEKKIIRLITKSGIPKEILNNWEVDSIRFVNRHIQLGDKCTWQNVGSLQCPYNGQMDWTTFSSELRARAYLEQRIQLTSDKKMSKFISQDSIKVEFENKHVIAQRNVLKIKTPKILLGGSNELTIYYVVAPIDDVYVACTMSHYSNDNNAPGLPPLLSEVMKLKQQ